MSADKKQQNLPTLGSERKRGVRFVWKIIFFLIFLAIPTAPHLMGLRLPGPPSNSVDAIIVLTGAGGRIAEGFNAWKSGAGRDLCILGAGKGASLAQLLPGADDLSDEERSRIITEGWSKNTLENAFSARSVLEDRKYSSVMLVTSDYHVPRAYYVFRKALPPNVDISVLRVNSERGPSGSAWRWVRRHFTEGWKYWRYRLLLFLE